MIERKHQNISAVLIVDGMPHIDGYKLLANVQPALWSAVDNYRARHPGILDLFAKDVGAVTEVPTVEEFLAAMEKPPVCRKNEAMAVAEGAGGYTPAGVNYLAREVWNPSLGKGGAGKSTALVLIVRALADRGYPVCVLDSDSTNTGLAQGMAARRAAAGISRGHPGGGPCGRAGGGRGSGGIVAVMLRAHWCPSPSVNDVQAAG